MGKWYYTAGRIELHCVESAWPVHRSFLYGMLQMLISLLNLSESCVLHREKAHTHKKIILICMVFVRAYNNVLKLLSCHKYSNEIIIIQMFIITGVFSTQKVLPADLSFSTCIHTSRVIHSSLCNWNAFPLHLCLSKSYSCVNTQLYPTSSMKHFLAAPSHND